MKIILSSKTLAKKLKEIDFETDSVVSVDIINNEFIVTTLFKTIKLEVTSLECGGMVKQDSRRWDWIKKLVSNVSEQPIVLHIYENITSVIFQY